MRFGFVGPSYTAKSGSIADEECINFYPETNESGGPFDVEQAYGGREYASLKSYLWTPGLSVFSALPNGPTRGSCWTGTRLFYVSGSDLIELKSDGTQTNRGTVSNDGNPASLTWSNVQVLIVSGGKCYCYTLATNTLVDVTSQLAGTPIQCGYSNGYFIVSFLNSNKFQISNILDGTTWNAIFVNAVSVFPDTITSIIVNHGELWAFGNQHCQPYQDTGSASIFDPIPGALIENGSMATFGPCRIDNSVFWIGQDERGGAVAWRSNGYTPQRISTHAVEVDLTEQAGTPTAVSYTYQDSGHLFWVIYIPGAKWTWVYDVAEGLWHKRAFWVAAAASYQPHLSWNHVYAFGKHLVGDWASGNVYWMDQSIYKDNGALIRRLRRSPTVLNEMERVYHSELRVNLNAGNGPQPPFTDGNGNPRAPQAMLRWSNDAGSTWSNQHVRPCGFAGEYGTFVRWERLGYGRRRVYEFSVTDPIPWAITDAYLTLGAGQ